MDKPFPPVSRELIAALQQAFPDRVPELSDDDRKVWAKVGQVSVVRFLEKQLAEQEDNILNPKVITDV